MTSPVENEDLYQTIELGGVESPGIVKLSGHDRKANWDIKSGSGQNGCGGLVEQLDHRRAGGITPEVRGEPRLQRGREAACPGQRVAVREENDRRGARGDL